MGRSTPHLNAMNKLDTDYASLSDIDSEIVRFYSEDARTRVIGRTEPDEDGNSPLPGNFGATGGAHHAAELPFMFGNPDSFILNDFKDLLYDEANKASRETISQVMTTYWGNFIRQSDPNGDNQPSWSPWSNSDGDFRAIVLDVNYADKLPKITEDYTVWTTQRVLDLIDAKVAEPLRSELLPYLQSRIDPD